MGERYYCRTCEIDVILPAAGIGEVVYCSRCDDELATDLEMLVERLNPSPGFTWGKGRAKWLDNPGGSDV